MSDITASEVLEGMLWPIARGETLTNHDWFPFFGHRFLRSSFLRKAVMADRRADLGTALILWVEAMGSDPAGTLPLDDADLAFAARFPSVEAWLACKEGALHGWVRVQVEDSRTGDFYERLGHPMTLHVAQEMMTRSKARKAARTAGADRKRAERIRKKLAGLGLPDHIVKSEQILSRLVRHFNLADIWITDENIRAALDEVIGYKGDIVPFSGKGNTGKSRR